MLIYGKETAAHRNITDKKIPTNYQEHKKWLAKFAHVPYKEVALPRVLHCFGQFFFAWPASRVQKTYTRVGLPFATKYHTK